MKKIAVLLFFLLVMKLVGFAQNFQKITVCEDLTLTGYYLEVMPISKQIDGVLLLLPGFSQAPESIFTESMLPYTAANNNLLTIAVAGGHTLFANEEVQANLLNVINQVVQQRPETQAVNWTIGGFSAGGTIALRFAEYTKEGPTEIPVNFEGVFTVDSPVDLVEIWNYFEREIDKNASEVGVNEARYIANLMQQQEGHPITHRERYEVLNPFSNQLELGNEKYLKNMAVRVYHEVDISWQLQNRRRSALDANYLYSSELINRLLLMGNERAQFMQATQKGYRSDGRRHTHSWSIVDEVECIQWVKRLCAIKA